MTDRADIARLASPERLLISGLVAEPDRTIVLLSPDEPAFWDHFRTSAEAGDGAPHPLDRWSERVIGRIAATLGAEPLFPFGGPPWHPFPAWAKASGQAWTAPVGLLVHAVSGLFVSYRGALAVPGAVEDDPAPSSPCPTCAQPCRTACPVDAFAGGHYDVPRCKAYLDTEAGRTCRQGGCLVRRACPVGRDRRLPAQSAFHMAAFHPQDAVSRS